MSKAPVSEVIHPDANPPTAWSWPGTRRWGDRAMAVLPGLALCCGVTVVAVLASDLEQRVLGRAWLEPLVLAILIGTAARSLWTPSARWHPGIAFGAKTVLEVAVMLLGASISFRTMAATGPWLLLGIACLVACAIPGSFLLCRLLGLPPRMAILVACGNSICGNSAIAAVAPIIGADGDDVAASIAFTAVLGVLVVLGLPLLVPLVGFSVPQYGVFAGLTVYAVPQVLAATAPLGTAAVQVGTLVKLVRVLMLGPVALILSILANRFRDEPDEEAPHVTAGDRPMRGQVPVHALVPWFILAFLGLAALRSLGLIPEFAFGAADGTATLLTVVSMAALGLGVDVRVVARAGGRVTTAVSGSLALLGLLAFGLIRLLGVA
jgi:uncharacterized integral membrane protein (TIGR00698 family)